MWYWPYGGWYDTKIIRECRSSFEDGKIMCLKDLAQSKRNVLELRSNIEARILFVRVYVSIHFSVHFRPAIWSKICTFSRADFFLYFINTSLGIIFPLCLVHMLAYCTCCICELVISRERWKENTHFEPDLSESKWISLLRSEYCISTFVRSRFRNKFAKVSHGFVRKLWIQIDENIRIQFNLKAPIKHWERLFSSFT